MNRTTIFKEFTFEAAHVLPKVPAGHKCGRLHGHSFKFSIELGGPVDADTGWVIDFGDVKQLLQPMYNTLDHNFLNDIPGLDNPTSENLAKWIFEEASNALYGKAEVESIRVWETCTCGATYYG